MKGQYIRSSEVDDQDDDKDTSLDTDEVDGSLDDLGDGGEGGEDSLDFGAVAEDGEGEVDEDFMEEVNSIDEFGSDSPTLSKEEVVDAVQAIDQIIEVILATEGVGDGEQPTSDEVNFVLDEVQDLAAGFDSAPTEDIAGDIGELGELPPEPEPAGEFDEEGFDEGVDEEFPEEIEASLVRVMVAGKPVKSKFTRPTIFPEAVGGVQALLCSGISAIPEFEEADEPAKDAIYESAVLYNNSSPKTAIKSQFTKVGSFKKWVMQSKAHKLAWRIASAKYRRLMKQSAKTPREKAAVFFLANSIYSKLLKSSGKKVFKLFSGKSVRAIRRACVALQNRFVGNKPTRVLFSDYNGYRNYETWNVSLYITKDNALCSRAKKMVQSGISDYDQLIKGLGLVGKSTPDRVAWSSPKIDRGEMKEVLSGLVSSFGGSKMAGRRISSADGTGYGVGYRANRNDPYNLDHGQRCPNNIDGKCSFCYEDNGEEWCRTHPMPECEGKENCHVWGFSTSASSGRRIKSNTQYESQGDVLTVQDDTNTGIGLAGQTLSDSEIEGENSNRVLNVDGGDTSETVNVHNTGDEGSLEADTKAGEENSNQEYGFDSQEMVGVELPIEGEDNTQVLELKHIGSGVYILNRSFVSPGAGRLSFCEGMEAQKVLSRNVKPSPIKANVDRCLTLNNKTMGLMLRSSAILGVIGVKAPYRKGLKNSKLSVFVREGVNLINEEGIFIPSIKGTRNIIASASSLQNARKGKVIKNLFSEVEGAYVKYLRSKVLRLLKANTNLKSRLDTALKVQQRRAVMNSQLLNKERRQAREQVASAMQGLDTLKKDAAEAEAQRLLASSASAVRDDMLSQKAKNEAAVDHLTRMLRW
jgi:hypothetical protein